MNLEHLRRVLLVAPPDWEKADVVVTINGLSYPLNAVVLVPASESETGRNEVHVLRELDEFPGGDQLAR